MSSVMEGGETTLPSSHRVCHKWRQIYPSIRPCEQSTSGKYNENAVQKLVPFHGIRNFNRKNSRLCLEQDKFCQHPYILYLRNIHAKIILQFLPRSLPIIFSALNCENISHFPLYLCLRAWLMYQASHTPLYYWWRIRNQWCQVPQIFS